MPLIKRLATDMFEFEGVVDAYINLVNLVGVSGTGLALEFRKRSPEYIETYREACRTKELRIGTIKIIETTSQNYDIWCMPTKRHYNDLSSESDIKRGLEALRALLTQDKYRYSVIGMPMAGTGLGKQSYDTVYPMMENFLEDLDATIFLSMAPDKTDLNPNYLTIAGPVDYGRDDKEKEAIAWGIEQSLKAWGKKIEDYTGIVSGGYSGVDAFVCGEEFNKDYENTLVYQKTGKRPLVCKPNKVRNGVGANLHLGNLLCEIGEDIILFKPKGHNNNRLSAMQTWLIADKQKRDQMGMFGRRLAIFGERDPIIKPDDLIIPQEEDIPY